MITRTQHMLTRKIRFQQGERTTIRKTLLRWSFKFQDRLKSTALLIRHLSALSRSGLRPALWLMRSFKPLTLGFLAFHFYFFGGSPKMATQFWGKLNLFLTPWWSRLWSTNFSAACMLGRVTHGQKIILGNKFLINWSLSDIGVCQVS